MIFEAFALMGIDAAALGEREFVFGGAFLKKLMTGSPFPLVCANLKDPRLVPPFVVPHVTVTRGGVRVLVTSVIDPLFLSRHEEKPVLADPVESLAEVARSAPHDIFVVVVHGAAATAVDEWLRATDGVTVAILSDREGYGRRETSPGGAVVVFNNTRGQTVSHVDLVRRDGTWRVSGPYTVRLGVNEVEEDPEVARLLEDYEVWRREYFSSRTAETHGQPGKARSVRNGFVGKEGCLECHSDTVRSWGRTAHARALESLVAKGKEYDPLCLPCHVTGMRDGGDRGGFVSLTTTPNMSNVQCEQCHGPGGAHVSSQGSPFENNPDENTCRQCHTRDTDPSFDYAVRKAGGVH